MILFLDFDGVLHPTPCRDRDFFCKVPLLENVLREFPEVRIVISSYWRYTFALEALRENFSEDIRPRIIGTTAFTDTGLDDIELGIFIDGNLRYQEILDWVTDHDYNGPWIALDDSGWEFPKDCRELMLCDPDLGFVTRQVRELRERLANFVESK